MAASDRTVRLFPCPTGRRQPAASSPSAADLAPARALSIRQPWAWAILHAGKTIENRTWPTKYRGPLLLHAGQRQDPEGWAALEAMKLELPLSVQTGGIVGAVDLIDCVRNDPSEWAIPEHWHWVLARPRPLPFQPCKGQLGIFALTLDLPLIAAA
jgi:hypothetical protein